MKTHGVKGSFYVGKIWGTAFFFFYKLGNRSLLRFFWGSFPGATPQLPHDYGKLLAFARFSTSL